MKKTILPFTVSPSIFFIAFLIKINFSSAQDYFQFQTFNHLPTYPSTTFYDIVQDEIGYIWLASKNGMYKFDGSEFQLADFPLNGVNVKPTESFSTVFSDSNGNIWCGTFAGGLYHYNIRTNSATRYYAQKKQSNSISDNRIKAVFEDPHGRIWIGCHKEGFCLYQPKTDDFKCYKPSNILNKQSIQRFLDDILCFHYQNEKLWIGTLDKLLAFDPETEELTYHDYEKSIINSEAIKSSFNGVKDIVQIDSASFVFVPYSNDAIIFQYNIPESNTSVIRLSPDENSEYTSAFSILKNNEFIYYFSRGKLAILNSENKSYTWIENKPLYSNIAFQIDKSFFDRNQNFWSIGKENLYLLKNKSSTIKNYGLPLNSNSIIKTDQEEIFFLAADSKTCGLFYPFSKKYKLFNYNLTGLKKNNTRIQNIYRTKDGEKYGHSDDSIYKWDSQRNEFVLIWNYPLLFSESSSESIMSGYLDRNNCYWLGTKNNGIIKVDLSTLQASHYINEPEKNSEPIVYNGYPRAFFHDDLNNVWYGTDVGFGYFNYKKNTFTNFHFPSYSTDDPAFQLKSIGRITKDGNGHIWLADLYDGLGFFEFGKTNPTINIISEKSGLADSKIFDIATDLKGNIWVSHGKGASKISVTDLTIENYGSESGIPSNAVINLFEDSSIGLLNAGQLQVFWPDELSEEKKSPKMLIKEIKILDEVFQPDISINEVQEIHLSYDQNFFSIEFGTINFENPEIQEVQYQLQGIHSNWINAENRNYASFAKVGGGNYTFKIRSRTIGGEWGTEKKIKIKIDPPFWDTWWFYILAFLSALFVVFFFYSYRVKKIKEQEELKSQFQLQLAEVEMKALRAQMNPHFLFNCLNSIKLFIVENDIKSASTYLTKFAKLIRLILQNSKNKFVTLADEMEALKLYIEMEKMRFSNQFEFSIQIDPTLNIASIEIPPLIIQPYVENAIWHGLTRADRPNRLTISISQIDNKLQCIIEDNGIGREASFKSNNHRRNKKLSMGMEITENRLSLTNELFNMKTVVNIEDLKNQDGTAAGTRVVLTVPFTG